MNKITNFICETYGNFEQINSYVLRGRLRIFYKYENRNETYITDDFAEHLISTLPYQVIVGIYDKEKKDFKGHSYDKNAASTYGVVPENPNTKWETHLDEDGVLRNYLTCEVYLFTRYEASKYIPGKKHSMELNPDTIDGYFKKINNIDYYVFTRGDFCGLSVLGEDFPPCFQGSAFYQEKEKEETIFSVLEKYEKYIKFSKYGLGGNKVEKDTIVENESEVVLEDSIVGIEVAPAEEALEEPEQAPEIAIEIAVEEGAPAGEDESAEDESAEGEDSSFEKKDEEPLEETSDDPEEGEEAEKSEESVEIKEDEDEKQKEYAAVISAAESKILDLTDALNTFKIEVETLRSTLEDYKRKCGEYELQLEAIATKEKVELIATYERKFPGVDFELTDEQIKAYDSIVELEKDLLFVASRKENNFFENRVLSSLGSKIDEMEIALKKYEKKNKVK